jgi:hypothetical protein
VTLNVDVDTATFQVIATIPLANGDRPLDSICDSIRAEARDDA